MRQPHQTQTKVDLTVPVDPETVNTTEITDCFGKEYAPHDKDCSLCFDIELCGIKFQDTVGKKVKQVETEQGPMMDQTDLDGIDFLKIEKLADKYYKEAQPMTFEELQEVVMIQAKTKDSEAVLELIKRELPLTRMILKDGLVYVR
jgi:hypothetical protein